MKRLRSSLAIFFLVGAVLTAVPLVASQEISHRLSNQDIIEMVRAGITDEVIIAKIHSMNGADSIKFDTSVEGLKELKAASVPDGVVKAMINPTPPPIVAAMPGAVPVADPNLPPPEIGAYWKDGPTFVFIGGEALSQAKAGGRAGSFFTEGMKAQHWNAVLNSPTSKTRVKDRRPLFYFYVADGTSSDDFVLLKLNKKGDRREFQIGTFGGMGAGKAGVKRSKELGFGAAHVAIRTYKITLDSDLKPGEYAFFMGTGQSGMMSSGRASSASGGTVGGRIYDFTVQE